MLQFLLHTDDMPNKFAILPVHKISDRDICFFCMFKLETRRCHRKMS